MPEALDALDIVSSRVATLVASLSDEQIVASAYPSEWTIAHVLSHIGSGAVIMRQRFEDACAGVETSPDFAQSVWDEWNAKTPRQQADDVIGVDREINEALRGLSREGRDVFRMSMGPMSIDFNGFVGMRLNEMTMHLWDMEVAFDDDATLTPEAVGFVVDNLEMIVRFSARGSGDEHVIHVRTTDPHREIAIMIGGDGVMLGISTPGHDADLVMPAEALARLVFGRLDPDHTPAIGDSAHLDELRQTFPGF